MSGYTCLASQGNGLVSLNLPPLSGDLNLYSENADKEIGKGSKPGSLSRLLNGFSRSLEGEDTFLLEGICEEPELLGEVKGMDEDGFIVPSCGFTGFS